MKEMQYKLSEKYTLVYKTNGDDIQEGVIALGDFFKKVADTYTDSLE